MRYARAIFDVLIVGLGLHVLAICITGGYSVRLGRVSLHGAEITMPVIALLVLAILRVPVAAGTLSGRALRSHAPAVLFSVLLVVYLANGRSIPAGDTLPARYLPLSILREGNFDLDEFPFFRTEALSFTQLAKGHRVSSYPVGAPLLALPFYVPSALGSVSPDSPVVVEIEKLAAATMVALSALLMYLSLRWVTDHRMALIVAVVYGVGTSSLSASSQALWQHTVGQLALSAALYCLLRGRREPGWVGLAGFPLAFAAIARPTDLLIAIPVAAYVLRHHTRHVGGFVLGGVPPLLFHLWYNVTYFGDPLRLQFFASLRQIQSPLRTEGYWSTPFWHGLTGLLWSPGRGLFVYSPVFLFSLIGLVLAWRRNGDPLLRSLGIGVTLTVCLYSKWFSWWGGESYGPRLLADLAPGLALAIYPLGDVLRGSRVLKLGFVLALSWSIWAHAIGAFWDDGRWDKDIGRFPRRLWSVKDSPPTGVALQAVNRLRIFLAGLPTSRTSAGELTASYRTNLPPTLDIGDCGAIHLMVRATNTGRAVWLAQSGGGRGAVGLRWRVRGTDQGPAAAGETPLLHDVFPGESYEFHGWVAPPPAPGTYRLEADLVSAQVSRISGPGDRLPIDVGVTVRPRLLPMADTRSLQLQRLHVPVDDPPRLALLTDQIRYREGDILQLSFRAELGRRPWLIDAYLLLASPAGTAWFYDGRRLTPLGGCGWIPLAKGSTLARGVRASGPLIELPTRGLGPGAYSWHLFITEVATNRIIADATTSFEVMR